MRLLPEAPQTGLGLVDGVRGGPCVLSVMVFGRWDWGVGKIVSASGCRFGSAEEEGGDSKLGLVVGVVLVGGWAERCLV